MFPICTKQTFGGCCFKAGAGPRQIPTPFAFKHKETRPANRALAAEKVGFANNFSDLDKRTKPPFLLGSGGVKKAAQKLENFQQDMGIGKHI